MCPILNSCTCLADINECDLNLDVCTSNAICHDSIGSYQCSCSAGFEGNGFFACQSEYAFKQVTRETGKKSVMNFILQTLMNVLWVWLIALRMQLALTYKAAIPAPANLASVVMEQAVWASHSIAAHFMIRTTV